MNIIKHAALILTLVLPVCNMAYAEPATSTASASNASETIAHLEKAIVEISKSDFNTAQVHLKAARNSSDKLNGTDSVVKQANGLVIQGQIKTKLGDIKSATDELNKAIALYQSIK